MKKIFVFLFILTVFLPLAAFDFARDGKALCTIVVPEKLSDLEIMGRDDLVNTLEKITGAKFTVVPESKAKSPAIYFGFTDFARRNGVDRAKLGSEEWVIKTVGKDLILSGGGIVGPYYAVQALLRKAGYYMIHMDQEVIPVNKNLSLNNIDEQKKPAFDGRQIYDGYPDDAFFNGGTYAKMRAYNMWMLRNLQNGYGQNACRMRPYYIGDKLNILQFPFFHSLMAFVPVEKYFKTHPEYYSMDSEGKRVKPRSAGMGGCLCMSNPEVAEVTIKNMLEMIRKDRKLIPEPYCPKIYDLSLLDNFSYICHCPECKKFIAAHGGKNGGETSLMLYYSNKVAEAVGKEFPDVFIRIFAYSCCQKPSTYFKPAKNIMVQYCDLFAHGDAYRPLTHKFNRTSLSYLKGWSKTGVPLMVWDYWNLVAGGAHRPETVLDTIQPDFKLFRECGVSNIFIECSRQKFCPQTFIDLQYFIGAQLMIDPDQDVEKLVDIFIKGYYGEKAAPVIRKYLDELRAGVKAHPNLQISIRIERWKYLTSEFCTRWYKALTEAENMYPADSPYRARISACKLTLMWFVCQSQSSYRKAFAEIGVTMAALKKECFAAARNYLHRDKFNRTGRRYDKKLAEEWEMVAAEIPVPELFKDVPEERLRVLGYPLYRKVPSHNSDTVPDKDAICGKALKSANKLSGYHGAGKLYVTNHGHKYWTSGFYLANIGSPGSCELVVKPVPQDEKYHWYRIPGVLDMNSLSYFWGHGWGIQMNISHVYVVADGISPVNKWQAWFRAKFTGPAYVKGSKKDNAIYLDTVVLTRPDEPALAKYPASGFIK